MAEFAILIGIYSYLVFGIGLLGKLYKPVLIFATLGFWLFSIYFFGKRFRGWLKDFKGKVKEILSLNDKLSLFLTILILAQIIVNLIGALGPELGFDALWYHLTLPKIYLQNHKVLFIPGNLLYYSAMPKLIEMIYASALAFKGEILAKLVHFSFGILSSIALFNLARRFLKRNSALIVVVIFYTNLVVGWQSITAYVDLGRTFFEILALDYFLRWWESQKKSDLIESGVMLGLAVATKLLALGSLLIFVPLIFIKTGKNGKKFLLFTRPYRLAKPGGQTFYFLLFTFLIPLPWFIFSFVHTGNPFYPVFSGFLGSSSQITSFGVIKFIKDFWLLFLQSADPISPIYLIFLPLVFLNLRFFKKTKKIVLLYCLLAYFVWFFTPRVGGGRFILPYLPAFSLICGFILESLKNFSSKKIIIFFILVIALINISYRALANKRYLPVILGKQTKSDFLLKNLNFGFGDFYETGEYSKYLKNSDLVLVSGIHNLYYINFPFVHDSWVKNGDSFTHLLFRGEKLPKIFGQRKKIYQNPVTQDILYLFPEKWHESN